MTIRHLAASLSGSLIAAGEFERVVHVWDILKARHVATFDTILDFGGRRLAISADGESCFAAAYGGAGVASYSISSGGTELWQRRDLRGIQRIGVSVDDRRLLCELDNKLCLILDRYSGQTLDTLRAVRSVWQSAYDPVQLIEKRSLVLQTNDAHRIWEIPRETFAVLSVSFGPGLVCVSESAGPVRCINAHTGKELWRVTLAGTHLLALAYVGESNTFAGIRWPYEKGGSKSLICLDVSSGHTSEVAELRSCPECAFCFRGSRLVLANGLMVNSTTGVTEGHLNFSLFSRIHG